MKIPTIIGPTASGKTAAAIAAALRHGGEVISCDSVQIYKGFDIGTAKPALVERQSVPHHMLDIISPSEKFSAGDYARLAREHIKEIASRSKLPIVCGGSGFYLRALVKGLTGLEPAPETWEFIYIGIHPPRDILEERIKARSAKMLESGLIAETKTLLESGVSSDCAPMNSIGYIQARAVLSGELPPEEAAKEIALRTRQYAKRQRTWFYNQIQAEWLEEYTDDKFREIAKGAGLYNRPCKRR